MEVPSPSAGTVKEVLVKIGDRVGKDKLIVRLEGGDVPSAAHAAPRRDASAGSGRTASGCGARTRATEIRRPGNRGLFRRACEPGDPSSGARTRYRSERDQGDGREGPCHQGRSESLARWRSQGLVRRRARGRHGHPRNSRCRLLEVRPHRDQADGAHQAHLRTVPASGVAQHSARHPQRRCGHFRDREVSQGTRRCRQGRQEEALPRLASAVPDEGIGQRIEGVSRLQQLARHRRRTLSFTRNSTISASRSTRRKAWSFRS